MFNENAIDWTSLADEAEYRAAIYRNLSVLFADAPGGEALAALVEAARSVSRGTARRTSEDGFYAYLREFGDREFVDPRRAVASEYAELFVGPRPPLAPLYESVYLGFPKRLFTDQTMSVRRFYERCGLSVAKDGRVHDDHVAYELELMAALVDRETAACNRADLSAASGFWQLEREFVTVHLGGWIGLFASRIAEAPCADFYRALSRFAASFVSEDDSYLGGLAGMLEHQHAVAADNDRRTNSVQD